MDASIADFKLAAADIELRIIAHGRVLTVRCASTELGPLPAASAQPDIDTETESETGTGEPLHSGVDESRMRTRTLEVQGAAVHFDINTAAGVQRRGAALAAHTRLAGIELLKGSAQVPDVLGVLLAPDALGKLVRLRVTEASGAWVRLEVGQLFCAACFDLLFVCVLAEDL